MAEEREVSIAATFDFPLVAFGSTDASYTTAAVFAGGDVTVSLDGGAFATIVNTTTVNIGDGFYSVTLTSSEMAMARGIVKIKDLTSTKIWEDQAFLIATYGSTIAMHRFNRNSSGPNVTVDLINAGKITSTSIAAAAFIAEKFGIAFLTSTGFAAGAINSTAIAVDAITALKIATDAITTGEIAAGVFTKIWAESTRSITFLPAAVITSTAFAAGAINSTSIATDAITAVKIATNAITTGEVAAGVFTKIWAESTRSITFLPAGVITSTSIAVAAIGSTAFAAGAINSTSIAANAITAGKIATAALTTDQIADGVFERIDSGVNTQVLDVMTVDTFGEPLTSTSVPPVSETLHNKIGTHYAILHNRLDVSTSAKQFYTSTGGAIFTKVISDTGIYTEGAFTTA